MNKGQYIHTAQINESKQTGTKGSATEAGIIFCHPQVCETKGGL